MWPVMFFLALWSGMKHFREELDGERVEAFACMDDNLLGRREVTINTVRAIPSPLCELGGIFSFFHFIPFYSLAEW